MGYLLLNHNILWKLYEQQALPKWIKEANCARLIELLGEVCTCRNWIDVHEFPTSDNYYYYAVMPTVEQLKWLSVSDI